MGFRQKEYFRGMSQKWYFLLREPISEGEKETWEARIREALRGWNAHGRPIAFEVHFPYNHYVAITARSPISGCAIDHLFRTLLPLLNPLPTEYLLILEDKKVTTKTFYEIIKQKSNGEWGSDWRVVEVVGDALLERRLEESSLAVHL